jgi:NTE family protein
MNRRARHDGVGVTTSSARAPRIAFVLSGGGNQGVAQVGMLRALIEAGIRPDAIIGCSAGALNGAAVAYAPNLTGVARLANVWSGLTGNEVFPGSKLSRAWNVVRRGTHLFTNDGLQLIIRTASPARSFADLSVPLRVIAADLDSGEEVVFARGPLEPALLASAALPGVFPIVEHGGRRLVDGGIIDAVPLWHAFCGPVDRIYVLNVSNGSAVREFRSPLDVVMASFAHSRNLRYDIEKRFLPDGVEILELPRPVDDRDLFDFSGGEAIIDAAYELGRDYLAEFAAAGHAPDRVARAAAHHRIKFRIPYRRAREPLAANS